MMQAWQTAQGWLDRPNVWIPQPTERHEEVLGRVITEIGDKWNLVPDAHLAALAIEHGLTVYSADRDFARFSGVRWENPLSS
jgi:predicted nucleic acid-binding protein